MGRKATTVNKQRLIEIIVNLEKNGPLKNRQALYEAVAAEYNKGADLSIKPILVYSRINEWQLNVKTPVGKRGRQAGIPMTAEHKAAMHAGRAAHHAKSSTELPYEQTPEGIAEFEAKAKHFIGKNWREYIKNHNSRYLKTIQRAVKGSRSAQQALTCMDCVGEENTSKLIRSCEQRACGGWNNRPYQKLTVDGAEVEPELDEAETAEAAAAK